MELILMFTVYILKSKMNGSYYVGSCKDVQIRFDQHNRKLVSSTKRYAPWDLIYEEMCDTLQEARKRERQIKAWKKRSAIERLIASKI